MSKMTKKEIRDRLRAMQRVMEDERYKDLHKILTTNIELDFIVNALDKELNPWSE